MTGLETISADIMERVEQMARFTEVKGQLTRRSFTPVHQQVNGLVAQWMTAAGMRVRTDAVGNVIGRYEGRGTGARAIMLGSHQDTVVDAGRYDGALGIVSAIDCVHSLQARGIRFDDAIEVVSFTDEEGVRYQSAFLGSRGIEGTFDSRLLSRKDREGISLAEAMGTFGLDTTRLGDAARSPGDVRCFLELHIEQGPYLEIKKMPVCAVRAISGGTRMTITIEGMAGHAGTVPMDTRQDALVAASECILMIERTARSGPSVVATVGQIAAEPGTTNVIPGRTVFSIDVRSPSDVTRHETVNEIQSGMLGIARRRNVRIGFDTSHDVDGVICAEWSVDEV
ncbi:MAG: Zn-dependent hydrolase, partial [Rhodobacteraceae bacterium]|nr:Zn-dependent hydrolase [Paracoccaceae bacterium]